MSQRTERLDAQICAELMDLLQREMKDPRVGFATVTRVGTARHLGSALALQIAAERLGKTAEVVAADPVPPWLAFLPRAADVRTRPQLEPDVCVVFDGPLSRTGGFVAECGDWIAQARVVNIDHHVSNDGDGAAASWIDADASATCEM